MGAVVEGVATGGGAGGPAGTVRPAGGKDRAGQAGAAPGYRAHATFTVATEVRRQLTRRRTQLALGFMVLLPLIVLLAFEFGHSGNDGDRGQFDMLARAATGGGLNFALFTLLVSSTFLLVVVVALVCGDTVSSDASWSSLRYLLAIPVPRARLLGVKLVVALATAGVALLLLTGTGLVAGTLRYGWHPMNTAVAGDLPAGTGLLRLLAIVGYLAVTLIPVAALAFLLSVSIDAPLGAVGGAVLAQILSNILDQITALGSLRTLLPTHYSQAWLGLLSTPTQTDDLVKGGISAVIYGTVFLGLAWWRFIRKDIVS